MRLQNGRAAHGKMVFTTAGKAVRTMQEDLMIDDGCGCTRIDGGVHGCGVGCGKGTGFGVGDGVGFGVGFGVGDDPLP